MFIVKKTQTWEKRHFDAVLAEKQLGGVERGEDNPNPSSPSPTHTLFATLTPDPGIKDS